MNDRRNDAPIESTTSGADGEIIRLAPVDDDVVPTEPAIDRRVIEPPQESEPPRPTKSIAREYFESMVVTFIMALFGMTFITQAVKVPTGSMLNTILVEDHLMVNKFVFGPHPSWFSGILPYREIRRGDIIVFKYPRDPEINYVKRVIGLPGETIEVHGTRVYINAKELPENKVNVSDPCPMRYCDLVPEGPVRESPGATYTAYYSSIRESGEDGDVDAYLSSDMGDFGVRAPFTIPADSYFCMGDNRENSEDSRVWGVVPRDNVIGRAMFVYWSVNNAEREPGSNVITDILTHTRWGRTGTLIK